MYLNQVKKFKAHPVLYFIPTLGFLSLLFVDKIFSKGVDTKTVIDQLTYQFGLNLTFVLLIATSCIGFLLVLFWVKVVQQQSITSLTTSRNKIDWKRIFNSFLIWSVFSVSMILLDYYLSPGDYVFQFNAEKFFPFLIIALIMVPMQTSFEEYLFRGNLMQGLAVVTKSRIISLLIPAFIFGLMHIANPEVGKLGYIVMVYYIGTGIFLGIITLLDEGLELALGFHAANNLMTALLVTSDWTVFQTNSILKDISEPQAGLEVILPVFVVFPILLYVFSKIYGWNNWKEKLTGKITTNATEIDRINS